ncbi:cytochrome P450 CYP82D47-like [Rhododendron vialii]|uniref:cytochrome P450 CYP82D47-like n=1 Tax=Rhododendron vialii TaxID=182163 RepID=UPI00265F03D3|nr:cytochrome P450 CYP82D47-like [Rhododendron vialii]
MGSFLPSPITIIPSIFIFFLCLYCVRRKNTIPNKKVPPEAGGGWPLIGHLPLLRGHMGRLLGALADKHGPIFTIRLGVHRAVVVSKPEIAKECLSGLNDNAFPNRPKSIAINHLSYNYANFALSPYGPYWREMRKITVLELLSNHRLAMRSHVRESELKNSVKEVYNKWVKKGSCLVEMKIWMEDITLKLTAGVIAGNGRINVNDRFREAFKPFFDLMGTFTMADAIPYLRWFDFGGYEKEVKKTGKKMDDLLQEWLNEHKRQKNSGNQVAEAEKDFMDVMLEILDGGTNKILNFEADTIIKATCVGLILGAIGLTSITLTWAVALLLNNPHVLKKAQEELNTQIGGQRLVQESDIKNLVYIQAIIKETLRLYPPAVLVPPRENLEDCTVDRYHIPAGTILFVNLWKIHHDPQVWPNPWEFRPERFLTTHKDVDLRGMHYELLPFGSGRRGCPAISFALQVLQFTLASLVHAFEIATPSDEPVDMTESLRFNNVKEMPLQVLLTPRLPSKAYG